jgi:hypothetical protein
MEYVPVANHIHSESLIQNVHRLKTKGWAFAIDVLKDLGENDSINQWCKI